MNLTVHISVVYRPAHTIQLLQSNIFFNILILVSSEFSREIEQKGCLSVGLSVYGRIYLSQGTGLQDSGGCQVQYLQSKSAGWRFKEEMKFQQVWRQYWGGIPSLWRISVCSLQASSTSWMRPGHVTRRLICFTPRLCLTLWPHRLWPTDSSVHEIFQLEASCHSLLQEIFPWGSNPHFLCPLHWQADSIPLVAPGRSLQVY